MPSATSSRDPRRLRPRTGVLAWLAPQPTRSLPAARLWKVSARTVHLVAMTLVVSGVAAGRGTPELAVPVALTVASGLVLLGIELWMTGAYLIEGAGLAVLAKLALLGAGLVVPVYRLDTHLAAIAVASIGSHMPKTWRQWSFIATRGDA